MPDEINQQLCTMHVALVNVRVKNAHRETEMESTLNTASRQELQKKWEEGAAARAYEKGTLVN